MYKYLIKFGYKYSSFLNKKLTYNRNNIAIIYQSKFKLSHLKLVQLGLLSIFSVNSYLLIDNNKNIFNKYNLIGFYIGAAVGLIGFMVIFKLS